MRKRRMNFDEYGKYQLERALKIIEKIEKKYTPLYQKLDSLNLTKQEYANRFNLLNYREEGELRARFKSIDIMILTSSMALGARFRGKKVYYSSNFPPMRIIAYNEDDYYVPPQEEWERKVQPDGTIEIQIPDVGPEFELVKIPDDPLDKQFQRKICAYCHETFKTFKKNRIYCCPLCQYKSQIEIFIKKRRNNTPKIKYQKICPVCGGLFISKRSDAVTCRPACRMALSRQRKMDDK